MESTAVAPDRPSGPRATRSAPPPCAEPAPTRSYDESWNGPPTWAVRRGTSAVSALGRGAAADVRADAIELARRTGLSKTLTRRCLQWLRERPAR